MTQFIDASGEGFFKKKQTIMFSEKHIKQIMDLFDSKEKCGSCFKDGSYDDISSKEYNLSVSSYVEAKR